MSGSFEPRKLIAIGLRWWWLILLPPIVAAGIGYYYRPRPVPVYEAATTLRVGQSALQNFSDESEFLANQDLVLTYVDMASRYPVLQGVIETLGLDTNYRSLSNRVKAKPVTGTELIEIRVTARSREESLAIADELARQLILLSQKRGQEDEEEQNFVKGRLDKLKAKIEAGQGRLDILETTLESPLSIEQVQTIQDEVNSLESLMSNWEANYGQLLSYFKEVSSPRDLTIIEPAQVSRSPVESEPLQFPLVGAAVGLALALGLVYLLESLDDTYKSEEDVSQDLDLSVLGTISQIRGKNYSDKLASLQDPFSPASETYRKIRSNMQFLSFDRPAKSILITSSNSSEGKSITVANLGIVMAQAGLKTVIVDTDLRRPVQHEIFQLPNVEGLAELLCAPKPEFDEYLRRSGVENLLVITSGAVPPNPSELVGSKRMRSLIEGLNQMADVVLYDSPPVLPVTDALLMSNPVDGVVLVVQAGKTRRTMVKRALASLRQADAKLLGAVINQKSARKGGGSYYSYYRHHHYATNAQQVPAGKLGRSKPQRRWQWLPFFK